MAEFPALGEEAPPTIVGKSRRKTVEKGEDTATNALHVYLSCLSNYVSTWVDAPCIDLCRSAHTFNTASPVSNTIYHGAGAGYTDAPQKE